MSIYERTFGTATSASPSGGSVLSRRPYRRTDHEHDQLEQFHRSGAQRPNDYGPRPLVIGGKLGPPVDRRRTGAARSHFDGRPL